MYLCVKMTEIASQENSNDDALLLHLISEYFDEIGFNDCKETLLKECQKRKIGTLPLTTKAINDKIQEMHKWFDTGNYEKFFNSWNSLEPIQGIDAGTLEFYLRIYFAIYPIKKPTSSSKQKTESMAQLKNYLELPTTIKLSESADLQPYYALPYVKKLDGHQLFKDLLKASWTEQLKQKMLMFTNKYTIHDPTSLRELLKRVYESNKYSDQYVSELERKYDSHKRRNLKLQNDYHNVILVASELVDALEQTIRGNPISSKHLQELCSRMLENKENHQRTVSTSQSPSGRAPDDPEPTSAISTAAPSIQSHIEEVPSPVISLDFDKLTERLIHKENHSWKETALILQALRLILTTSEQGTRESFISQLIDHNILKLNEETVIVLLYDKSEMIREQMCRLINTLASMKRGRSYLVGSTLLLPYLVKCIKDPSYNKISMQHIVAALQKLSVRRSVQMRLIKQGFVSWLLQYLDDYTKISDYALEYACALLMNLSLTTIGKKSATEDPELVLNVLSELLKQDKKEIRPYLNGTLYSILSLPNMRHKAKKTDLCHLLDKAVQHPKNPNDVKQIPYVIKQLNGELIDKQPPPSDDEMSTAEEDEDEEEDYLEIDLNANDSLEPDHGHLSGLPLLQSLFPSVPEHNNASPEHKASVSSYPTTKRQNNKWASGNTYAIEKTAKADVVHQIRRTEGLKSKTTNVSGVTNSSTFTVSDLKEKPTGGGGGVNARKIERGVKSQNKPKQNNNAQKNPTIKTDAVVALTKKNSQSQLLPKKQQDIVQKSHEMHGGVAQKSQETNSSPVRKSQEAHISPARKSIEVQNSSKADLSGQANLAATSKVELPGLHDKFKTINNTTYTKLNLKDQQKDKAVSYKDSGAAVQEIRRDPNVAVTAKSQDKVVVETVGHVDESDSTLDKDYVPGLIELPNTRIPDDSSKVEYIAAFGSRPKVVRTPDTEAMKRKNGAHFMIF